LLGLTLTVAGGLALMVGLPWLVLVVILILGSDPGAGESVGGAILCAGGGLAAVFLGDRLGRFARGDYD
jgi:hypothetical protein